MKVGFDEDYGVNSSYANADVGCFYDDNDDDDDNDDYSYGGQQW